MKLIREEFARMAKSPFIALVFLAFLAFNAFLIYQYVGEGESRQALEQMHETVLDYGVNFRENGQDFTKEGTQSDEFMEFYESYIESYGNFYEDLDMMSILERKEEMADYHPTGAYGKFIHNNYQKLQKRVEEIKDSGEGDYGFYPGLVYEIHGILYGKLGKKLLLEMAVLVILCILFLLDYERIHKTRDLVIATKTGKKVAKTKAAVGLVCGFIYSGLLMLGTYAYFFWNTSFAELWKVPVASVIMTEKRGQMIYPFVTFWRMTEAQYFLLNMAVFFLVLLVVGGLTIAFWMILQNSYFVFLFQCMIYMACYLLAYQCHTETFLDVAEAVVNPASLWITCGAWFMENDISLSFVGNEFWCVGCSGVLMAALVLIGRWRYRKLEL